jgi:hypothetical protein
MIKLFFSATANPTIRLYSLAADSWFSAPQLLEDWHFLWHINWLRLTRLIKEVLVNNISPVPLTLYHLLSL